MVNSKVKKSAKLMFFGNLTAVSNSHTAKNSIKIYYNISSKMTQTLCLDMLESVQQSSKPLSGFQKCKNGSGKKMKRRLEREKRCKETSPLSNNERCMEALQKLFHITANSVRKISPQVDQ